VKHGIPSHLNIKWDGAWGDIKVFAGLLEDFPPQSAFADPFGKITNLGKSTIEVHIGRVVIDAINKLLHYQVDDVGETMEVASLILFNWVLQESYLVIPGDSQLTQLLLQGFRQCTVVGCTIGSHTKKFIRNFVIAQSLQNNACHVFTSVMIAQAFERKEFLMVIELVINVVEGNP